MLSISKLVAKEYISGPSIRSILLYSILPYCLSVTKCNNESSGHSTLEALDPRLSSLDTEWYNNNTKDYTVFDNTLHGKKSAKGLTEGE